MVNIDNGKTHGFKLDKEVPHVDLISGDEGRTTIVRISGGEKSQMEIPFMILKNTDWNYPIISVPDDIPGVLYRTGPKGSIDRRLM